MYFSFKINSLNEQRLLLWGDWVHWKLGLNSPGWCSCILLSPSIHWGGPGPWPLAPPLPLSLLPSSHPGVWCSLLWCGIVWDCLFYAMAGYCKALTTLPFLDAQQGPTSRDPQNETWTRGPLYLLVRTTSQTCAAVIFLLFVIDPVSVLSMVFIEVIANNKFQSATDTPPIAAKL